MTQPDTIYMYVAIKKIQSSPYHLTTGKWCVMLYTLVLCCSPFQNMFNPSPCPNPRSIYPINPKPHHKLNTERNEMTQGAFVICSHVFSVRLLGSTSKSFLLQLINIVFMNPHWPFVMVGFIDFWSVFRKGMQYQ